MDNTLLNKNYNWELLIVGWLYKLSLKHPRMSEEFEMNGFGPFTGVISLYGDLSIDDTLVNEMKSLEEMMRDKPKIFRYDGKTSPVKYSGSAGPPKKLKYYFDLFRKELRDETLDNLLEDDD